MGKPEILWDIGTAYDFFVSLVVLHNPTDFGVRSAWASGMRQRLPTSERELLETFTKSLFPYPPLHWIYQLPQPKDSHTALSALAELPPLERVFALTETSQEKREVLDEVALRGEWNQDDRLALKTIYQEVHNKSVSTKKLTIELDAWTHGVEFSQGILTALQVYKEVFFEEEEHRILPALNSGLSSAQGKAHKLDLYDLLFDLSQGVSFAGKKLQDVEELVLAPSYWVSPFVLYNLKKVTVLLFGARPPTDSLVPGELVPETLLIALAALSDPTRLRILRYLASESLTPTQLATRLRLRTPTVVHHLRSLRAAGLVSLLPGPKVKETLYQARLDGLETVYELLKDFVVPQNE